ncbi:hypothetical protein BIWAKO_05435 [Bosea sp. BIWAKO-01]|nr:hypothetical protein BIWAKO_05435 [Bosea sp. BIWAKO-01]
MTHQTPPGKASRNTIVTTRLCQKTGHDRPSTPGYAAETFPRSHRDNGHSGHIPQDRA